MTEPEHTSLPWRKSSASVGENCVEVAVDRELVYIRHSGRDESPVLEFSHQAWHAFVAGVLKGEFTLPTPRPS